LCNVPDTGDHANKPAKIEANGHDDGYATAEPAICNT